ncbi:MAG: hypothetical protein IJC05_00950 [Phascolarctobacterium sp.]|nr:hypothetical protein [Phascolarctobacterium sp.]
METLDLKCTGIQFNMYYEPVTNIRDRAIELESKFKDMFPSGFTVFPDMGPMAPLDAPRIMGTSVDGSCGLALAITRANITRFRVADAYDAQRSLELFKENIWRLYDAITGITSNNKVLFCGITMYFEVLIENGATDLLKEKFIRLSTEKEVYDLETKFTFVENDTYYINLSISNLRDQSLNDVGFVLQLDVNDRYRFNCENAKGNIPNFSEGGVLDGLCSVCFGVLESRLDRVINDGAY